MFRRLSVFQLVVDIAFAAACLAVRFTMTVENPAMAAVVVALVALWRRSTTIAAAAGAVVLAVAASRLDVFSRALVPGSIPATIQRLLLVAAVAGGAATVFAALLGVTGVTGGAGSARYARTSS